MKQDLLETIKSRGYWRINFQPLVSKQKLEMDRCRALIKENAVEFRGWDYPHFPIRIADDSNILPAQNYYVAWVDWRIHKEFWRMYQSGQFIHYRALWEDWLKEDSFLGGRELPNPKTVVGVVETVYQLTEIFEFASRLCRAGIYDEGLRINLRLCNIRGRSLWASKSLRIPLSLDYRTEAPQIDFENQYAKEELFLRSKEAAYEVIIHVFDRFGWHTPNKVMIEQFQGNLLNRRLP